MSERLVIIDGKSVFYRGYYAMPNLSTKEGTPTGGVYGFAMMALEVIKRLKPDYVCVAWDKSKTNIRLRRELCPAYKANRKPAPPDFYEQIPILHDLLDALEWPLYEVDDYEADDIMGAFAKQAGEKGIESYLITSDLDVLQLINSHTHIYTLKKGLSNIELFNVAYFEEKYGVGPHQWADVKALKGDASDNIPGVAGIGEKTALQLIKQYETLEGVYNHLDELKPAVKAKLEKDKDMALLSQKLVTLMVDAPVTIDLEEARLDATVTPEFVGMLRKLEFSNLLRQVERDVVSTTPQATTKEEKAAQESQQAALGLIAQELKPAAVTDFISAKLKQGQPRVIALNPEATELWVSTIAEEAMCINPDAVRPADIQAIANGPVIGHDLKTVFRQLLALDIPWEGIVGHDTRIGAFLLNSLIRSRELADIIQHPIDPDNAGEVIAGIWQAYDEQKEQFKQLPDIANLAKTVEFPAIYLLAKMEHRGVLLNTVFCDLVNNGVQFAQFIKFLGAC